MRLLATVGLCLVFASVALAGDGDDDRYCEACLNIDESISPTATYQTVSGSTVGQPGSEYSYSFCAVGGGVYRFTFCEGGGSATYDTALSVQGPDACGAFWVCNDDYCGLQSQIDFTAPFDGTFIVVVDGFGSNTGSYTLAYRGPECEPVATEAATWGSIKTLYR